MHKTLNIVLVHTQGWQAASDLDCIRAKIEEIAPDIEAHVVSNLSRAPVTARKLAARPSLIFSPLRLLQFRPLRGRVYQGQVMSKLTEMQMLAQAGLPVPVWEEITPETRLDEERYGSHVVVKPAHPEASWGNGIELMRTADVRYRAPQEFPEGHPGRLGPMFAQRFIDCGQPMTCRVLTFFGEPIFTYLREAEHQFAPQMEAKTYGQAEFMPVYTAMRISCTRDADFLDLAARAFRAIPEAALQACDLLRDREGRLHILEVNPGGGTWMFSSKYAEAYKAALGVSDLTAEFDAFTVIARKLVEAARREAC